MTEGIGVMSASFSEGPVFEDNDSVFSDLPSPSEMNSGPEVPKIDSKHQRKTSTGSSVWNNVIVATPATVDECRNDVSFLPEEEDHVDQNELFEDELRASVLSTRITVNASDADLKDTFAAPLAFFHSDSLHKHRSVDSEKRDSYIPSALFTDSKKQELQTAEKSHHRKKSVDDSILDKVITVAKDSEDADEDEDSLFDTVSQLTKDQPFEFESTIKLLIENSGVVLDSAVKNIMENTNFAAEKIEEADCSFLTPMGDVAACGDMTERFWNKDEASIEEESNGPNGKTFIDFGSLNGTQGEKSFDQENLSVPDTPDETQEILRSLDGNQVGESDEVVADDPNEVPEDDDDDVDDASQHVVVCKLSKDEIKSLGLHLVKSDSGIIVSRIDPESALAASDLKPGMTLLAVNGNLCPNTVPDTVLMIKSTSGEVEVTASFRRGKISISPAAPHREVAELFIQPIQEGVDVDEGNVGSPDPSIGFASFFRRLFCGLGSTDDIEDEEALLKTEKHENEEKFVSETTESVSESSPDPQQPMRTFTFRVQRLSWQDPIGVKLKRGKGGIVVAEIMPNSPFRFTGLRPGMRIHEINGIGCPGLLIVAENLLKGIENDVELVVTREVKKFDSRPVPLLFYSDV